MALPVLALAGAALSAIGTGAGAGISASAMRKARNNAKIGIEKSKTLNDNLLNYEMGLPRYSTQTVLNQTYDKLRDRKAARTGAKNVVGGTQASVQAGDTADAETLATAAETGISQALDDRKRAVENYTTNQTNLNQQEAAVESGFQQGIAQNTATATKGLSQAAGQFIASSASDAKTTGNTTKEPSVNDNPTKVVVDARNTQNGGTGGAYVSGKTAGNTTSYIPTNMKELGAAAGVDTSTPLTDYQQGKRITFNSVRDAQIRRGSI